MKRVTTSLLAMCLCLAGMAAIGKSTIAQSPVPSPSPSPTDGPTPVEAPAEPTPAESPVPIESPTPAAEPPTTTEVGVVNSAEYRCKDRKGFKAEYLSDSTVRAMFGSKEMVLPQVESASGARYSNGSVTINTKGNAAFVEVGDKVLFESCVVKGTRSVQGLW